MKQSFNAGQVVKPTTVGVGQTDEELKTTLVQQISKPKTEEVTSDALFCSPQVAKTQVLCFALKNCRYFMMTCTRRCLKPGQGYEEGSLAWSNHVSYFETWMYIRPVSLYSPDGR